LQATDIELGEPYYLRAGTLADAIYASSAILPFYPPLHMNDRWLADGVFSEFLPLHVVLDEKSDLIIAVDPHIPTNQQPQNFMFAYAQFLQKSLKISSAPRTALIYDIHNDEILIIPVKVSSPATQGENLEEILASARMNIEKKEAFILEMLGIN